jgi:glutaminyl-peptide cyclotransferase
LDVAEALTPLLEQKRRLIETGDYDGDDEWAGTTLQMVFFDGEEAFHDWTDTDSIYGAR